MRGLMDLLARRRVEFFIPVGPDSEPDDPQAVKFRDDTLARLTRIIDNLLSIGTRLRAPTFFEPTVKKRQNDDGWI